MKLPTANMNNKYSYNEHGGFIVGVSMSGSMGVAYSDILVEGGSVRGRVSGAGNIEINIAQ
jgi:hypothetical protein